MEGKERGGVRTAVRVLTRTAGCAGVPGTNGRHYRGAGLLWDGEQGHMVVVLDLPNMEFQ